MLINEVFYLLGSAENVGVINFVHVVRSAIGSHVLRNILIVPQVLTRFLDGNDRLIWHDIAYRARTCSSYIADVLHTVIDNLAFVLPPTLGYASKIMCNLSI